MVAVLPVQRGDRQIDSPSVLVIDSSYTLATIRRLGLEQAVFARDVDGFFGHVWSVHPFGELADAGSRAGTGPAERDELNDRHTFIQAKPGRHSGLSWLFPLNFLLAQGALLTRLRRLVRQERVALVRAGDPLYCGLLGWMVAKSCGIPLVVRINGNNDKIREGTGKPIFPRLLRSIAVEKAMESFVLRRADLVVAPNQDNVDFAVANGAKSGRVSIFRYGNLLSPAHLRDPRERGFELDVFKRFGVEPGRYLLCVSRLQEVKFPEDAVHVLAFVKDAALDVRLIIAGEGPMRSALERLATELGVADRLVLPGNLDQASLAQLYPHAAAVISPLTGRALSEAALGGAPIAAYDLDWQGDLIETGVTGELVPFRDMDGMGRAVAKFLDDPAYADAMGKAVRKRAFNMLDPVKLNAHERATYSRLLRISSQGVASSGQAAT